MRLTSSYCWGLLLQTKPVSSFHLWKITPNYSQWAQTKPPAMIIKTKRRRIRVSVLCRTQEWIWVVTSKWEFKITQMKVPHQTWDDQPTAIPRKRTSTWTSCPSCSQIVSSPKDYYLKVRNWNRNKCPRDNKMAWNLTWVLTVSKMTRSSSCSRA